MHPTVRKCTALLRHQPCPVSDPTPWLAGTFKREDNSPGYTRPLPSIVSCVAASDPRAQVLEFEIQLPFRQMNENHNAPLPRQWRSFLYSSFSCCLRADSPVSECW
jgi:hypothetical protein